MTRNSSKIVLLAMVILLAAFGCKSRKKASTITNANAEKDKMEQDAMLRKQKEDEKKRSEAEEEAKLNAMKGDTYKGRLTQYFDAIANSTNITSANTSIDEALYLFNSPEAPVLIVISEENGQKDYDRPTTIRAYLNYLKDQKKNINQVQNVKVDASGKITEVELRKNN